MTDERRMYKRKYKQITVAHKVEILRRLEAGEKNKDLAAEYGITRSTITYVAQHKENVKRYSKLLEKQQGNNKKTRMDGLEDSLLDKCILQWLEQQWALGEHVSPKLLKKKALIFNERLEGSKRFVASNGWVTRFKNRHGIRDLSMKSGVASRDLNGSKHFCKAFNTFLLQEGYDLENVYTANATCLRWKSLPKRMFASSEKNEAIGKNILENRVTIMACTNATGTHRIKLLVIGKLEKPRCFENVVHFPVVYRSQKSACIDQSIFEDWFKTEFLPAVTSRNDCENKKFLMLLDNASSYPTLEKLNAIDSRCKGLHFPPNSTSIQPMNNGVIETLKILYRKAFLREIQLFDSTDFARIVNFLNQWTILDACRTISNAWNTLDESILANAWKILLNDISVHLDPTPVNDVIYLLNQLKIGSAPYTSIEIEEWLRVDEYPSREELSDDQIIAMASRKDIKEENIEEEDAYYKIPEVPKPREILTAMETILRWYECNPNTESADFQSLSRMRNVAIDEALAERKLSDDRTFNFTNVSIKEEPCEELDIK